MCSNTKRKQYHILNGDSLKDQFPNKINGDIIITRECFVDGDVKGGNLVETRNMEWKRSGKEVGKGWKEDGIKRKSWEYFGSTKHGVDMKWKRSENKMEKRWNQM